MVEEKLSISEVGEIAREVTKGYDPLDEPCLEDITWAFPIGERDGCYLVDKGYMQRIPNTQEYAAMMQLMLFRNFHNVLTYLTEERTVGRGIIPHHTCAFQDADDMCHVEGRYWRKLPDEVKKAKVPHVLDVERRKGPREKVYFWENLPEELARIVLRTHGIGLYGLVDEWGFGCGEGARKYKNPALVKEYLENMRSAVELGRNYLSHIAQNKAQAARYPQLVLDNNVQQWKKGDEFQLAYFKRSGGIDFRSGRVTSNDGRSIEMEFYMPIWADTRTFEPWRETHPVSVFKEDFLRESLWKIVPPTGEEK